MRKLSMQKQGHFPLTKAGLCPFWTLAAALDTGQYCQKVRPNVYFLKNILKDLGLFGLEIQFLWVSVAWKILRIQKLKECIKN